MDQTTKPEIWPTDKPYVVFMVPAWRSGEYAVIMNRLILTVLRDLDWEPEDLEVLGLVATSPQHCTEGIYFLEQSGIDTRKITLLMLWGETAEWRFGDTVSEECGVGTVILPETGVILPTVRMPSLNDDWWDDPLHQAYAATVFANLVQNGRSELDGSEPFVFVAGQHTWN